MPDSLSDIVRKGEPLRNATELVAEGAVKDALATKLTTDQLITELTKRLTDTPLPTTPGKTTKRLWLNGDVLSFS